MGRQLLAVSRFFEGLRARTFKQVFRMRELTRTEPERDSYTSVFEFIAPRLIAWT